MDIKNKLPNVKGIIYVDSHGYRGYCNNYIQYLKEHFNFIGGEYSLTSFNIIDSMLYFQDKKVDLKNFSHVFFCYRCDAEYEPLYDIDKQPHLSGFNKIKFLELEDFFNKNNFIILNKIKNYKMDADRISFFSRLKNNKFRCPDFEVIKNRESIEDINIKYPLLLRTNSDYSSKNAYLTKNKEELYKYYDMILKSDFASENNNNNVNKKIMVMEFVESYNKQFKGRMFIRIIMVNNHILLVQPEIFPKEKWTHRQVDSNINSVSNNHSYSGTKKYAYTELTHFKDVLNLNESYENLQDLIDDVYEFSYKYVNKWLSTFHKFQKVIDLNTIAIDFIPLEDGPVFLEVGIKQNNPHYMVMLESQVLKYLKKDDDERNYRMTYHLFK